MVPNLCQALTAAQPATSWEEAVKVSKYTDTAAGGQPCESGSSCDRGGPLGYAATPPGLCSNFESLPPALQVHCPVNIPTWNSQSGSSQHDQLPTLLGVPSRCKQLFSTLLLPSPLHLITG